MIRRMILMLVALAAFSIIAMAQEVLPQDVNRDGEVSDPIIVLTSLDYTHRVDFQTALAYGGTYSTTSEGVFLKREAIGYDGSPAVAFYGNALSFQLDDGRTIRLWWNPDANILESGMLCSTLPNSRHVTITYDPVFGLVESLSLSL